MAWQLIYTSAPRLLEAGRSGFGTVARHRAIHPILASALERDSQFDRSAVRGRVVFAHRIIAAGGSRFHVLSCIRETGADYTGRTNHIAHHLIIDPREVSLLGSAAPSPVDVCRGMTWRTTWPDAPKWLEASEEISLIPFHSATTPGGAWQAITGDARYAGNLRPATNSALIVPPETDALALFGESQTVAASQAWQATFTNCIQPTDDLSEFRWVAVEAASPMRERATGGRTVLDLTAPETLPAPPESRSKLFIPAPDALLTAPSSLAAKSQGKPVGSLFDAQLAAHAPRAQKGHRRKSGLLPYIVVLVLLAAGAAYWGFPLVAEALEHSAQRTKIREDVKAAFTGSGIEEAEALAKARPEQLRAALAIAEAARKTHDALQNHPIGEFSAKAEDARELAKKVSLNIPNSVGQLFDLHSAQWGFQQRTQKIRDATLTSAQLTELESLWKDVNLNSKNLSNKQAKLLSEKTKKSVELLWAERLLAMLKTDASPTKKADWFDTRLQSHLTALSEFKQAHAESQPATDAKKLIKDWKAVEAAGDDQTKLPSPIQEGTNAWPAWLVNARITKIKAKEDKEDSEKREKSGKAALAASAKKPASKVIFVTDPEKPEQWLEFANAVEEAFPITDEGKGPKPLLQWQNESLKLEIKPNLKTKQNENDKESTISTDYRFQGKQGLVITLKFWVSKPPQPSLSVTLLTNLHLPSEFLLKKGDGTIFTVLVFDRQKPFLVADGLIRDGDKLIVSDPDAKRLCEMAGEMGLTMVFPSDCKNLSGEKASEIRLPVTEKDGAGWIVDFSSIVEGMRTRKKSLEAPPTQTGTDPKTKKACDAIGLGDWDYTNPKQLAEKLKSHFPNDNAGGKFNSVVTEVQSLQKQAEAKVEAKVEAGSLLKIDAALDAAKTNLSQKDISGGSKANVKNSERNKTLDLIKYWKSFIAAYTQELQADGSAKTNSQKNKTAAGDIGKHPFFTSGLLPPGEYAIFVKRSPTEHPLPFIRFTIAK